MWGFLDFTSASGWTGRATLSSAPRGSWPGMTTRELPGVTDDGMAVATGSWDSFLKIWN